MALTDTTIFRQINSETPMYAASGVDYLINGLSATYANKTDVYTKNEVYTKGEVDAKVTGVYHFKGSVETFNDLLSVQNPAVGDTYNVSDTGKNYAWTGSATSGYEQGWDALGGIFDLEDYYTCEEIDPMLSALSAGKVDKVEGMGLSHNDFTDALSEKLNNIAPSAQVNVIETIKVDNTPLTVTNKTVNIDLTGKVDVVEGMGLSHEDFTSSYKTKLDNIAPSAQVNVIETIKIDGTPLTVTDKTVEFSLSGKVDKQAGMGLTHNDFTDTLKNKLDGIAVGAEVNQNAFSVISDGTTNTSATAKQDTFTVKGAGSVTVSLDGKTLTVSGAATDISGKADKTSFESLKGIADMPAKNYNLDDLVTKFNAMAAILRNIGSALNPQGSAPIQ